MLVTESRLTAVAEVLLDGLDENAVDFRTSPMTGKPALSVEAARRVPEPFGHRLQRHRRRHGDLHPAPQAGRILHRDHRADRKSQRAGPLHCRNSSRDRISPLAAFFVEEPPAWLEAYKTGRGGFSGAGALGKEEGSRGTYQIVVTEISPLSGAVKFS